MFLYNSKIYWINMKEFTYQYFTSIMSIKILDSVLAVCCLIILYIVSLVLFASVKVLMLR